MAATLNSTVLAERFGASEGTALRLKQAALVILGIAAMALAAKIRILVPPSPVPVNLGTFAVLTIGAAYGPRLGLTTILGYMIIGALGFDVFASSSAAANGTSYMMGATGGYLAGYVLAVFALGVLARRGWDKSVVLMALAMLIGNVILYVPGLAWLAHWISTSGKLDVVAYGSLWDQTMVWGITPYLIGDAMKLALAALIVPGLWKLLGSARG